MRDNCLITKMTDTNIVPDNLRLPHNNDEDLSASHYALKLALQTMKERCQKLQKRLTCLEDENLQLRIERHSVPALVKNEPKSDLAALQKQVEELNRQKSLLCHHIYMVATENKDLWERLSKVSDEKDLLDINGEILSSDCDKLLKPENSFFIVEACKNQGYNKEDSLEEISLKILSSLKKCKAPANDGDLHDSTKSGEVVRECEFTLDIEEEEETSLYEALMVDVTKMLDKLKTQKIILKQQNEGLKAALDIFNRNFKEKQSCKNCVIMQNDLEKERSLWRNGHSSTNNNHQEEVVSESNLRPEPNFNISKNKENAFEDRICPLCAKFYPKSTPFDEFNEHVLSHFVEEPEQDSLMSNFELIT